ncbi:GDP-L-fucose synthase [Methylophilus sp. QUAN]|uniref:GDP-L-fucose synthase family protein n=1 Tax=Methylophilus sp. QUAN TaxID=2781020 RepID=UPI0018907725|nr:GDP-L-fucose synthase [Methylophilus sp. QUAN]MBF4991655.1 GDP-L-fucose synthase [Methylophilus sp. QUAN]
MRILLTGGSGLVGKNLIDAFADTSIEWFAPTSQQMNLLDYPQTRQMITELKPELVIHAAGMVGGIQANIREPVSFLVNNLDMGRNLLMACLENGVKQVLNLGSSCMYPRNHQEPLTEEMILTGELEPTNEGYALAKIVTARLGEYIQRENPDFNYKTLIPCNLYGKYDKFDPKHSHLIPAIIHKIHLAKQHGDKTVEIWGTGEARREFMYAGDLAQLIVSAIGRFSSLPALMNVGLGYDYTINEYYEATAEVIGYEGTFVHDLSKPVGMARKLVNVDKQTAWGWQPTHSLKQGIASTYHFYLKEQQ